MKFYLISPPSENQNFNSENFERIIKLIPVKYFQFRPKHSTLFERTIFVKKYYAKISKICVKYNIKLIINDDFEISKKMRFDGIHLGQSDRKCEEAKEVFGKKFIVGVSCSNSRELYQKAKNADADYVAFGPVYKTFSKRKKEISHYELNFLQKKISLPFTLIGGINHENIKKLIKFKPDYYAVISSIWEYPTGPIESAKIFRDFLKGTKT